MTLSKKGDAPSSSPTPRVNPPKGGSASGGSKASAPVAGAPSGHVTATDGSQMTWTTAKDGSITVRAGVRTLLLTKTSDATNAGEELTFSDLASGVPYLKMTSLTSNALDTVKFTTQSGKSHLSTTFENPKSLKSSATVSVSGELQGKAVNWSGVLDRSAPTSFITKLPAAISGAFKDELLKASYFAPALTQITTPAAGGQSVPAPVRSPGQGGRRPIPMAADGAGSKGTGSNESQFAILAHAALAFGIVEAVGAAEGAGWGLVVGPEGSPPGAVAGLILKLPEAICTATIVLTAETVETVQNGSNGPPPPAEGPEPQGGPDDGPQSGPDTGPESGPDVGPESGPDQGPDNGPDNGPDFGPDTGPENGPDQGPDNGPDFGPDTGPDGPDNGPDTGPHIEPGPEPSPEGPEPEGPEPGPDGPGPGPGPDVGPDTGGMKADSLRGHVRRGAAPQFAPNARPTLPKRKKRT